MRYVLLTQFVARSSWEWSISSFEFPTSSLCCHFFHVSGPVTMVTFKARLILLWFIIYVQVNGFQKQSEEPSCYSRFDYEYKLLTKVVALETTASKLENLISHLEQKIDDSNKRMVNQNTLLEHTSGKIFSWNCLTVIYTVFWTTCGQVWFLSSLKSIKALILFCCIQRRP